jgi:hypothetical protein
MICVGFESHNLLLGSEIATKGECRIVDSLSAKRSAVNIGFEAALTIIRLKGVVVGGSS